METITIQVTVGKLGQEPLVAKIESLDSYEAQLTFADNAELPFQPGEVVALSFSGESRVRPVTIHGLVREVADDPSGVSSFQFLDWMGLAEQLPDEMRPYFSRRSEPRLELNPPLPTTTIAGNAGQRISAETLELSLHGIRLRIPGAYQSAIKLGEPVTARFKVPNYPYELSLGLIVLHRDQEHGFLLFGGVFDDATTIELSQQREIIREFLEMSSSDKNLH